MKGNSLVVLTLMLLLSAVVNAQEYVDSIAKTNGSVRQTTSDSDAGLRRGTNEFGVWGGFSFHSPTLIGTTRDVRFGNIALRYGRVLAANKTVAFEWTIDVTPIAMLSVKRLTFTQTAPGTFAVSSTRERHYAAGASPIGFKFNFRPQRRVQPYASTSGGFLIFGEQVPVPGATRFNFTFDFSGGVQIINSSRRGFNLGYKFQHISNAGQSRVNPGVDVHMVYAGFSIFR